MNMTTEKTLTIDGNNFSDFKGFIAEFNINIFGDNKTWSGNIDQLDDMLRGGYGTPEGTFSIRWLHSAKSRIDLGHAAMFDWLTAHRKTVHPTNIERWDKRMEIVHQNEGETLFLWLVDIIVCQEVITLILE